MAKSIVLYGPQGSGKTRYGKKIARQHGLQQVMDLDDVQLNGDRLQRTGYLYLCNSYGYGQRAAKLLGTQMLDIGPALASIGVQGKREGVARG